MKKVIDMNPFFGLTYKDEQEVIHHEGQGLTIDESERLQAYFDKYSGIGFKHEKSIQLAELAINNLPIPDNFDPRIL